MKSEPLHVLSAPTFSSRAAPVASTALDRQLQMFATEQSGYVHRFPDGKWSVELEWICTTSLARAAVTAYLAVRFLMRFFETQTLVPFAVYCFLAGLAATIYFAVS